MRTLLELNALKVTLSSEPSAQHYRMLDRDTGPGLGNLYKLGNQTLIMHLCKGEDQFIVSPESLVQQLVRCRFLYGRATSCF